MYTACVIGVLFILFSIPFQLRVRLYLDSGKNRAATVVYIGKIKLVSLAMTDNGGFVFYKNGKSIKKRRKKKSSGFKPFALLRVLDFHQITVSVLCGADTASKVATRTAALNYIGTAVVDSASVKTGAIVVLPCYSDNRIIVSGEVIVRYSVFGWLFRIIDAQIGNAPNAVNKVKVK